VGSGDVYVGDTIQVSVIAAACGDPAGVSVSASAGGAPIGLTARGDGLYTGAYTATTAGSVSIVVSASTGGLSDTKTIPLIVSPVYAITPGGAPVTVTTTVPGQKAKLTFGGSAGRRVSVGLSGGSMKLESVSLTAPDGSTLVSSNIGNSGFVDVKTLPTNGSYAVLVDPSGTNVGSLGVTLYDVPPDATGAITPGGPPVTVTASVPGQNAKLTFSGAAGQRVSLVLGSGSMSLEKVSIVNPDGSTLVSSNIGNSGFVDVKTLPASGGYAVLVDPSGANVGSLTLTLYSVPPDVTGAITAGGAPVTVTASVPGQNARLTFNGSAGRQVTLKLSGVTLASTKVSILNPDGSTLVAPKIFGTSGTTVTATPASSGTYTIVLDPQSSSTGSATLTLT